MNKRRELYTLDQYFERYFEIVPEYETYREAYEKVEREHVDLYSAKRYSSYISFRQAKKKYIDRLRKK